MRAELSSRSQQLEQMQAATSSQSSSRLEQQLADTEHQFNELLTGVSPGSLRSEIDSTHTPYEYATRTQLQLLILVHPY